MSDGRSMTTTRALRLLDLEQGVAPRELRETYRDLVRVWHPDRFEGDVRLQHKASARLSDINAAYRFLSALDPGPLPARSTAAPRPTTAPRSAAAAPRSAAAAPPATGTAPRGSAARPAAAPPRAGRTVRPSSTRAQGAGSGGRAVSHLGFLVLVLATFALGAVPRLQHALAPRAGAAGLPPHSSATDVVLPAAALPTTSPALATAPVAVPARAARSPFSRDLARVLARAAR
jgi:hypothetical protein